jgi:hypothetical protein
MGLNRRLERRLEVVLPLGRRPARPGRLHRRCFARTCGGRGHATRKRGEGDSGREVGVPLSKNLPDPQARGSRRLTRGGVPHPSRDERFDRPLRITG